MKSAAYLDAVRSLPLTTVTELTAHAPFLVLSPHPDDETLGTGGLIAGAVAAGIPVDVVVLTDGSGSHPRSQTYPRQRLIDLRRREVADAAGILGLAPNQTHHLDLVDTQAPLSGPAFNDAVRSLTELVVETGARSIFVTWEMDQHCDHVAAAAMARAVCRHTPRLALWAYPIWGWHLADDVEIQQPLRGVRLDISENAQAKRAAIAAHRSQMTNLIADDPDGFTFTEQTLAPFLGNYEYFIEVGS